MKQNHSFFRNVCNLAIPVALQSMLQSSFGIVDQIMIGQLGSVNIAGWDLRSNSPASSPWLSPLWVLWPVS